ncbi:MAG: hypothetical protein JW891_00825 [Candidatus Lokiarchaeota archaeon]|nr:hypothetical protein [Candidatus Lokiarchaeota archaeon]
MIFDCIVALTNDRVGLCAFDFYSFGHICLGIAVFLFLSLFYTIPKYKGDTPYVALVLVFIVTLALLILWEIIENTLFFELGWKFENRRDSSLNIFTDILFGTLGAIGTWLICHYVFVKEKKIWGYYAFGLIAFLVWLILFFVTEHFTV